MIILLLLTLAISAPVGLTPAQAERIVQIELNSASGLQTSIVKAVEKLDHNTGKVIRPKMPNSQIPFPVWAATPLQMALLQKSIYKLFKSQSFIDSIRKETFDREIEASLISAGKEAGNGLVHAPQSLQIDAPTAGSKSRIFLRNKILGRGLSNQEQRRLEAEYYDLIMGEHSITSFASRTIQTRIFGRTLTEAEEIQVYKAFNRVEKAPMISESEIEAGEID